MRKLSLISLNLIETPYKIDVFNLIKNNTLEEILNPSGLHSQILYRFEEYLSDSLYFSAQSAQCILTSIKAIKNTCCTKNGKETTW